MHGLVLPDQAIADFCRHHHIRRLSLFGSALRGTLRPDSDVDVLVEFEDGHIPGFAFFEIQEELAQVLGRAIDLNTPQFLSPRIRRKVETEAEVVFGPH